MLKAQTRTSFRQAGPQRPLSSTHAPKRPASTHSGLPIFTILYNKYSDGTLRTGKAQSDSVQQDAYAALEPSTAGQRPTGHRCTGAVGELQQPSPGAHSGRRGVCWVGPARGAERPPSCLHLDLKVCHCSRPRSSRAPQTALPKPGMGPLPQPLPPNAAVRRGCVSTQSGVGGDHVLSYPGSLELSLQLRVSRLLELGRTGPGSVN